MVDIVSFKYVYLNDTDGENYNMCQNIFPDSYQMHQENVSVFHFVFLFI